MFVQSDLFIFFTFTFRICTFGSLGGANHLNQTITVPSESPTFVLLSLSLNPLTPRSNL